MWFGHFGFGLGFLFAGLLFVLFWIGVVIAVVLVLRALFGGRSQAPARRGPETPLEIAARRYASGEISEDEYNRIKATLQR